MGTNPRAAHRSLTIAPGPPAGDIEGGRHLGAGRLYRGADRSVLMPNVTSVREVARGGGDPVAVPVSVSVDDALVAGQVGVSHRGGLHYGVSELDGEPLVCSRDGVGCGHVDEAIESTRALLEARQIRTGLHGLAAATEASGGVLDADHAASMAAQEAAAASGRRAAGCRGRRTRRRSRRRMTRPASGGPGARRRSRI